MQRPDHQAKQTDERAQRNQPMPAEGPHARPDLTDEEKTPGTGALPDPGATETDAGPD